MAPKRSGSTKKSSSAASPALAPLRPSEIWYTFGKIRDTFSGCGRALEATLAEIQSGALAVSDLPPIAVITHDVDVHDDDDEASGEDEDESRGRRHATSGARKGAGRRTSSAKTIRRYYSMNNRRLWVLKACEASGALASTGGTVGVRMESREACERLLRKGSRNFRLDRCTPGPVKLIRGAPETSAETETAPTATEDDDDARCIETDR